MRRRGQQGASLVLVLGLIVFLALIVPAVLGLVTTGLTTTGPVREDRRALYAANSALDAAIQQGRVNDDVGRVGADCPQQTLEIDGLHVDVTCEYGTRWCDLDRSVAYTAVVRDPGPPPTVLGTATADVVFRFSLDGAQPVEVRQWDSGAEAPATTTTLPPCDGIAPTTTTTVPPTSTTVPIVGSYARWTESVLAAPMGGNGSNWNRWRAEGEVAVADHAGVPLVDAEVTVQVQRSTNPGDGASWVADGVITGTTTATGTVTFHSPTYKPNGNSADSAISVRFTVVGVAAAGLTWNSSAHPVTVEVPHPSP